MLVGVTGGSGFIGSHLVEALLKQGCEVRVLDLKGPLSKNVEFFKASITDSKAVNKFADGCDRIFHLASMVGVVNSAHNGRRMILSSVNGMENIVNACLKFNVDKLIFSSSSEVYGNSSITPTPENAPLAPISAYGISKLACEEFLRCAHRESGLKYLILRYAGPYGPRVRSDLVISKFAVNLLNNEPLIVHDASSMRDFTFIGDVISLTLLASNKLDNDVLNICSGEEIKILDLAVLMKKISGRNCEIIVRNDNNRIKEYEVSRRLISNAKAGRLFKFAPTISLEEGLRITWSWFISQPTLIS